MKASKINKSADYLSLIELEQLADFQITESEAGFVQKIHSLRNKMLRDFTIDEVRVCLAQDIGVIYLLPKALGFLETNPWSEAEHYEGDLLNTCIDISHDNWNNQANGRERMLAILNDAMKQIALGKFSAGRQEARDLERGFHKFKQETEQGGNGDAEEAV